MPVTKLSFSQSVAFIETNFVHRCIGKYMISQWLVIDELPPSPNDGRLGSVFVRETRFSRDNHLGME
jgi:hypothetical protein